MGLQAARPAQEAENFRDSDVQFFAISEAYPLDRTIFNYLPTSCFLFVFVSLLGLHCEFFIHLQLGLQISKRILNVQSVFSLREGGVWQQSPAPGAAGHGWPGLWTPATAARSLAVFYQSAF